MKNAILFCGLFVSFVLHAQNRDEIAVLNNARSLNDAVFKTKDSSTLERLFASSLSYGHSSGKVENRQEAMRGILSNRSSYADIELSPTGLWIRGTTAVTRYILTTNETNAEGKINPLKLHIMLVWVKEKKEWKLLSRQAVRVT